MSVLRFDTSVLSKKKRTPSGGLRVDARLTRTGVLAYRKPDGSIQKELRLPEEVFNKDSLASLQDAPVTDLHPSVMVTSDNWKELSVGHLSSAPRQDGIYVAGSLAIQDKTEIERIDSGDRKEISLGYACKLEMTSGVWEGEHYDAIQREIRYNHIGLGPAGWGRAGSEVSIRMDSNEGADIALFDGTSTPEVQSKKTTMDEIEIKLDGETVKVPKLVAVLFNKELQAKDTKIAALETNLGKAQGDLETVRKDLADAKDPAKVQARVDARVSLEASARKVLGEEIKFDGKTERQIQEEVVVKAFPEIKLDGKTDDFVSGLFASATSGEVRNDSLADVNTAANQAKEGKKVSAKDARAEMMERNRNAYKAKK